MLARTVLLDRQTGQLLKLLWVVEPADITDLRQKSGHRLNTDTLDLHQLFRHRDLLYQ